ncbi:hypothetical protein FRC04_008496 [Tulasnella sp. 424]|nr:hypothetical protein FRC04_008496 [Tulasnella sp. 424]
MTRSRLRALVTEADELIPQLCWKQYYHNLVEQVDPFVRPLEKQDCLQTKTYGLAVGQSIIGKLIGILIRGLFVFQMLGNGAQTILEGLFLPPSWSSTPRPDEASTLLSRFTSKYKTAKIMQIIDTADFDTSAENLLVAVVQARAVVDCQRLTYMIPRGLAVSGDRLFITTTPVNRESSPRLHLCQLSRSVQPLETSRSTPATHPMLVETLFGRLQAHSNKVWADGGRRIRAYDSDTLAGDLVHVLNSSGKFPAFDDRIIRLKSEGELAFWRWEIWWTFAFSFVDTIAKDTSGKQAHLTFKVTGLTRLLQELEQLALKMGLYGFAVRRKEPIISSWQSVARLVTHQDILHFVVAAGNDSNVRIFDYRNTIPFPQLLIQGNTHDLQACAVAGFGGTSLLSSRVGRTNS